MLAHLHDPRLRLLLTSFAILYFELICIRWTPSYIRALIFFPNFILIASFLGIGLGCLMARRRFSLLPHFPALLVAFVLAVGFFRFDLTIESPESLYFGSVPGGRKENDLYFLVPLFFLFVVGLFVLLAQEMGRLFRRLPPLQAYAYDIGGSLLGIAAFAGNSVLGTTPPVWFGVLALALLLLRPWPAGAPRARAWAAANAVLLAAAVGIAALLAGGTSWSPYYKIVVDRTHDGQWEINVNNVGMQWMDDVDRREPFYHVPYWLFGDGSFRHALIIGAGSGTDTAAALRHGVGRADAVEIDPFLLQLGARLHPNRPYDDPRVRLHVDDARSFLRNTGEQYDLIVFGLPDSLTLTSGFANLRLESFLFTLESFASARAHLTEDGVLVLYNYYREDWLVDKLAGMLSGTFGAPPVVITYGGSGKAAVLLAGPGLARLDVAARLPDAIARSQGRLEVVDAGHRAGAAPLPATDDWPFLYIPDRPLPVVYVASLVLVGLLAIGLTRAAAPPGTLRRFQPHFFFMGAAFLLLETKSVVSFSLLFGSTWLVNSLVFFAILAMVFLAVMVNRWVRIGSVTPLFVALFCALAIAYALPPERLLIPNAPLRYAVASLLVFSPILLANLIFSRLFRESVNPDVGFASNLLGAVLGGLLEYLSLSLGYQFLILVVAVLYALAFGLGSLQLAADAPSSDAVESQRAA
ncbi:MAG: spermidine synthase [Chloroflexi bacterium]|nr:spermidine synthase [Chloroflexota bacterium]